MREVAEMSRIDVDVSPRVGPVEHIRVNGVRIAYEVTGGGGIPLVLVHGSWGSHRNWDAVVPRLASGFRVVAYDRRGHSDSDAPPGPGTFAQDVADLAALIEHLGPAPAWVAGNSAGAVITLQLAAARPELLRGIMVHEPPMWSLLTQGSPAAEACRAVERGPMADVLRRISAGDDAGAAELFVDAVALGPGSWAHLPDGMRRTLVGNARTFLDEARAPDSDGVDEAALARYEGPVLLTSGDRSPPVFAPVLTRLGELLPQAEHVVYPGAGHIPHVTHPDAYVKKIMAFTSRHHRPAGTEAAVSSGRRPDLTSARCFDVTASDGTPIAVWEEGAGPPFVLVHGSLQDHTISAAFIAELRENFTTFAMDRRGFGASGDSTDYAIEQEFEDVAAVVDAVAARTGSPPVLWGHSYGASLAMGGATLTRNIRQMILYEPSLGLTYPEGWVETLEKTLSEGDGEAAIVLVFRDVLGFTDDEIDAMRSGPEWNRRVAVAPTVAREARAEEGWTYRPGQFDAITARTALLAGSQSPPELKRATEAAAAALPGARTHVLDGHAHIAHRTDPAMVAALVRKLIAS